MSYAYSLQSLGDQVTPGKFNEHSKALGVVWNTGFYPFISRTAVSADLSGAATTLVVFHALADSIIYDIVLLYTEASSGDDGIVVEVGNEADRDYYYTGATEADKDQWYEKSVTKLKTDVAGGDTVTLYSPGAKVGTGEIMCIVRWGYDLT